MSPQLAAHDGFGTTGPISGVVPRIPISGELQRQRSPHGFGDVRGVAFDVVAIANELCFRGSNLHIVIEAGYCLLHLLRREFCVSPEVFVGLESGHGASGSDVFFVRDTAQKRVSE